ncbi:MAG: M42 family metallopeptidase [Syntrophobacteraceae bacterium]|jgi:putative aminopeptidase FrvX
MEDLLRELVLLPGLSGYEAGVAECIVGKIQPHATAEVDAIGNVTATVGSGAPRMLFASHMDEIGMMVSYIEPDGFLRIRKIGLLDDRLLIGRAVEIMTRATRIPGVIGIRPPHLMPALDDYEKLRHVPTWDEIAIDVGTSSREETEALGIAVTDPIVFKKDFIVLNGNRYAARGLDDRFGCALLVRLLEEASKMDLDRQITFAWTVQEEIGAVGGQALSARNAWDIMFAVDSFASADVPGVPLHYGPCALGKGPVIRSMDHRSISTPGLAKWAIDLARRNGIPLQFGPTGGYTDGLHFLARGVPVLMLSVPVRYMHSPVEMIDRRDLEGLFRLLMAVMGADKEEIPNFKQPQ